MEKELFVRMALCVDPRKDAAAGISKRAIRSFLAGSGLSGGEKRHRKALQQKIFRDAKPFANDVLPYVLPGLGPHPGLPASQQLQITIPEKLVHAVAKKIVRGCEYWLANGRIIEPPYEIETFHVPPEEIPEVLQMFANFGPVHLGPGFRVRRAAPVDDPLAALYEVVAWSSWTVYAAVLPPAPSQAAGQPLRTGSRLR